MAIDDTLRDKKCMLVASTGGHLAQLVKLASRWGVSPDSLWVTFDTEQSRSLLDGKRVMYVPYVAPRDIGAIVAAARQIRRARRVEVFDAVVSTGAGVALASHPQAAFGRALTIYVESVSRTRGPSLTGRILQWVPRVRLLTPHAHWRLRRWSNEPSVFSEYVARSVQQELPSRVRVFVTLGTIRPYGFERLVRSLAALPADAVEFVWQVGETEVPPQLPGSAFRVVSASKFRELCEWADVIVSHAGVGSLMEIFELGVPAVVVPRRKAFGEHVDDHQGEIAEYVRRRGLAEVAEADEIDIALIRRAMTRRVESQSDA